MKETYALLISARAEAAFFDRTLAIAAAEVAGIVDEVQVVSHGDIHALMVTAEPRLLPDLIRLSCIQGVFRIERAGWVPLDARADFLMHPDFVWGEKYRGKTNETLTQLMINLGCHLMPDRDPSALRLFDPMCGRGTTLLWAMRYGMRAVGVEQDSTVLAEVRRGLKKWTKLHRQKHKLSEGWIQKSNKQGVGKYLEFSAGEASMKLVIGDSSDAFDLTQRKAFDLIVTDIPYGVQHMGGKGTTRNPLETLQTCAPVWARCLAQGGAMAISFNANIPKRDQMISAFDGLGLEVIETDLSHRMSESILRDVLMLHHA